MYNHTRVRFSEMDYQFISATLGKSSGEETALRTLLVDQSTMSELLHDVRLFERIMHTPPLLLLVSPHLFFYIFVYRALAAQGIYDDDIADYIAAICTEFRYNSALWQSMVGQEGKTIYLIDLLRVLQELDEARQYQLRCHIGNLALFLTGFFPDFIYTRSIRKAAPGLGYYESVGRAQYDAAAGQAPIFEAESGRVLSSLAEQFVLVRTAINVYTDLYLRLSTTRFSLSKLDRQAATLDTENFRLAIGSGG